MNHILCYFYVFFIAKYFQTLECCVFRPAFGCLQHSKAGRNILIRRFSTFFVHFRAFSVISRLKSTKNEQKKHVNLSTPMLALLRRASFWPPSMFYISFLFRINHSLPCLDLNPGPPGTKQIAYQCATVLQISEIKLLLVCYSDAP